MEIQNKVSATVSRLENDINSAFRDLTPVQCIEVLECLGDHCEERKQEIQDKLDQIEADEAEAEEEEDDDPDMEECTTCNGTGVVDGDEEDDETECPDCDGGGEVPV